MTPTIATTSPRNCPPGLSSRSPYTIINIPNKIARISNKMRNIFIFVFASFRVVDDVRTKLLNS